MLRNNLDIAFFLIAMIGCSKKDPAISSAFAVSQELGSCLGIQLFQNQAAPPDQMKEGNCPQSLSIDSNMAKIVYRCDSFKDGNKNEYQWVIYELEKDPDGNLVTVSETKALQKCTQFINRYQISK